MSGCRTLISFLYALRTSAFGPAVIGFENFDGTAFGWGQATTAAARGAALVLGAVSAQNLMRVFDAQTRPGAGFGVAHGLGFAFPDLVLGPLCVQLGLGGAVEEVPFLVIFAHVLLAEPEEVIQNVRCFGRAELARLLQPS